MIASERVGAWAQKEKASRGACWAQSGGAAEQGRGGLERVTTSTCACGTESAIDCARWRDTVVGRCLGAHFEDTRCDEKAGAPAGGADLGSSLLRKKRKCIRRNLIRNRKEYKDPPRQPAGRSTLHSSEPLLWHCKSKYSKSLNGCAEGQTASV